MRQRCGAVFRRAAPLFAAFIAVIASSSPVHAQAPVVPIPQPTLTADQLLGSPFNLSDIDLLSGTFAPATTQFADAAATATVIDLVGADMMAFDTARLAEQARRDAEARRRREAARAAAAGVSYDGVPRPLVEAAVAAVDDVEGLVQGCRIDVPFLLGNAKSESGNYWDRIDDDGVTRPPLLALEPMATGDTDNGLLDGRTDEDFALGIFQFAPSTWLGAGGRYGIDANGDGIKDPQNSFDAALAAAWLFCELADGANLITDRTAQINALGYYTGGQNWRNSSVASSAAQKKYDNAEAYRQNALGATSAQTTVGPDGCPTSAPVNTLRGGRTDIATLCARSVASAPSPAAAQAVKFALRNVGVPYSLPKRNNKGYFDCSSLVTRAYQSAGVPIAPPGTNAPTTHSMLPRDGWTRAKWSVPVSASSARPGDLVFPHEGHVTMLLADGQTVHAPASGDVVHVRSMYSNPLAFRRVDIGVAQANPWRGPGA